MVARRCRWARPVLVVLAVAELGTWPGTARRAVPTPAVEVALAALGSHLVVGAPVSWSFATGSVDRPNVRVVTS